MISCSNGKATKGGQNVVHTTKVNPRETINKPKPQIPHKNNIKQTQDISPSELIFSPQSFWFPSPTNNIPGEINQQTNKQCSNPQFETFVLSADLMATTTTPNNNLSATATKSSSGEKQQQQQTQN
jgi:hypothetical protein